MEPKRTLHSGNLVRGVHAEEEERFIKKLERTKKKTLA